MSLTDKVFKAALPSGESLEEQYPPRGLKEGAKVTRLAPSPTGYLHLGVLFAAMINRRVAGPDGVFFLRLEDTDKKREIEGGADDIINGINGFGIKIDEGFTAPGTETGAYGPYIQSKRVELYHAYVKKLMDEGLAYPCFCTPEQLDSNRKIQEQQKQNPGYYGEFAPCRNLQQDETERRIAAGEPYVVRLKSPSGSAGGTVTFDDLIKGKITMPENDLDIVLLKSDGVPTYHFAHAVDDHLMRTTHVIRGDEWISSTPIHLQLFKLLGFKPPKYAHISPICKDDGGGKRKLSKRKDPEAAMRFYHEQGFPAASVMEYLMTIASSGFEDWRQRNQTEPIEAFPFNLKNMSVSGAMFDYNKLLDVSKSVISRMGAEDVAAAVTQWAEQYDEDFYTLLFANKAFTTGIFSIDRGGKKPRKDIAKWSDAKSYSAYFFDSLFDTAAAASENEELFTGKISKSDAAALLERYLTVYDENDDQQEWFSKIKSICPELGFCPEVKEYKADPDSYKGHVGEVSSIIRVAVTGRQNTPDLCAIMKLLGKDKCARRIEKFISCMKGTV